jgi:hypothetical protein
MKVARAVVGLNPDGEVFLERGARFITRGAFQQAEEPPFA